MLSLRDSLTILLINASTHLLEKWLFVQSLPQAVYVYKRDAQEHGLRELPKWVCCCCLSTVSELPVQEGRDLFCPFIQYLILFWSSRKSDLVWNFAISRKAEMINVSSLDRKVKMLFSAHIFYHTRKLLVWQKLVDIFKELS